MFRSSSATAEVVRDIHGGFNPLPTQARFLCSPTWLKFYVGPMGSGKSEVGARHAIDCCAGVPGNVWAVGRYTKSDFDNTTRVTFERIFSAAPELVERVLPGGDGWMIRTVDPDRPSKIKASHFDESGPYASMDLGGFFVDEVNGTDLSPAVREDVWKVLVSRLGRLRHVVRPYGLCTGMPGGHNWAWRLACPNSAARRDDCEWFKPLPFENAANLRPNYYQDLLKHGEEWATRYVYGSDDVFEGMIYPELSEARDMVSPFPIPPTWPRSIVLDHGQRNPTAVLFFATNEDGVCFLYDEHYEAERPITYHAEKIKLRLPGMEKAREVRWIADPSIFNKTPIAKAGRSYSIFDEYSDSGLDSWEPGENDVAAGRNRIKEYLKAGKLKFFRGRVSNAWREMTELHWRRLRTLQDRDAPEEEADVDNHCPDCIRYFVMSRPDSAARAKEPELPPQPWSERRKVRTGKMYRQALKQRRQQDEGEGEYV